MGDGSCGRSPGGGSLKPRLRGAATSAKRKASHFAGAHPATCSYGLGVTRQVCQTHRLPVGARFGKLLCVPDGKTRFLTREFDERGVRREEDEVLSLGTRSAAGGRTGHDETQLLLSGYFNALLSTGPVVARGFIRNIVFLTTADGFGTDRVGLGNLALGQLALTN